MSSSDQDFLYQRKYAVRSDGENSPQGDISAGGLSNKNTEWMQNSYTWVSLGLAWLGFSWLGFAWRGWAFLDLPWPVFSRLGLVGLVGLFWVNIISRVNQRIASITQRLLHQLGG